MISDLFENRGVRVFTDTKLVEVNDEGAVAQKADGTRELFKADTVIAAMGFRPAPNLKEEWAELNIPMYEVGEATGAGTIM